MRFTVVLDALATMKGFCFMRQTELTCLVNYSEGGRRCGASDEGAQDAFTSAADIRTVQTGQYFLAHFRESGVKACIHIERSLIYILENA
jgi:hypothetical protein